MKTLVELHDTLLLVFYYQSIPYTMSDKSNHIQENFHSESHHSRSKYHSRSYSHSKYEHDYDRSNKKYSRDRLKSRYRSHSRSRSRDRVNVDSESYTKRHRNSSTEKYSYSSRKRRSRSRSPRRYSKYSESRSSDHKSSGSSHTKNLTSEKKRDDAPSSHKSTDNYNEQNQQDDQSEPQVQSAFKNDGSFLELFKKMQEQSATNVSTEQKPIVPMIGRRRGGKVLKTGVVAKPKAEDTSDADNKSTDPWAIYINEVKKYRQSSCQDESTTRSLVK